MNFLKKLKKEGSQIFNSTNNSEFFLSEMKMVKKYQDDAILRGLNINNVIKTENT